ncbi:hypothetical protein DMENIID0001_004270 [Sergentomyia squamirostris]
MILIAIGAKIILPRFQFAALITNLNVKTKRAPSVNKDPVPFPEYRDERVQEGHQYQYRVLAVNAAGAGKPGEPSSAFAARPMKEAPRLNLDSIYGRKIKVRAGEPINVEIPLSGAPQPTVEWKRNGLRVAETGRLAVETNSEHTALRVDASVRGDAGKYTVTASNEFGTDSGDVEVIVVDKPGPPDGPLTYSATTQESISLVWNPPLDDGGGDITGYLVEVSDAGSDRWRQLPGYCPKCTFTARGLTEGQKYEFRVRAENIYGVSEPLLGKPVLAKSPYDVPEAPDKPTVLSYTPNSATLLWRPPDYSGGKPITGYYVEKRERGSDWHRVNGYPTPNTTFTVPDLVEGQRYEFRVAAVNEAGKCVFQT